MLRCLQIRDLALIEALLIESHLGLQVISGETGAGKSILIDAFALLCGQRASKDLVRKGASRASIEACFEEAYQYLPPELCAEIATAAEIDEGQLLISREIDASGKSLARLNGRLCSLTTLKQVSSFLIALHSQNEQQSILDENTHLALLDMYAGNKLLASLQEWRLLRERRTVVVQELKRLGQNPKERSRKLELLNYQIDEISAANFQEAELQLLQEKASLLSVSSRIEEDLSKAIYLLNGENDTSCINLLHEVIACLGYGSSRVDCLHEIRSQLIDISEQGSSASRKLQDYYEQLNSNSLEAEKIYRRLDEWELIRSKYGSSLAEVKQLCTAAKAEAKFLAESELKFNDFRHELLKIEEQALVLAQTIYDLRRAAADSLEQAICEELSSLNMPRTQFTIQITRVPAGQNGCWALSGRDQVAFFISPNTGEDAKALAKIISGGEASRVILALKSILANCEHIPVLIFDEIDTGISGKTATKVGEKLAKLAEKRQVFCVTHMAQIAALADFHYHVSKSTEEGRTRTKLLLLNAEERCHELARLLSGKPEDIKSLELAATLLQNKSSAAELEENNE